MKKILSFVTVFALLLCLVSCTVKNGVEDEIIENPDQNVQDVVEDNTVPEVETVKLAGLKGPTSMGLVKLLDDNTKGTSANKYEFVMAGNADEIAPKLMKGELDIAAIPANLASVLYNNSNGNIKVLAINNLGVLYIVEKGGIVSEISDLAGKTIYATGKGQTPEYTLRYILAQNGIDPDNDVTIEFKSEPTEVVSLLNSNETAVAMLPQPYVTVAMSSVEGLSNVIDLNAEWDKLGEGSKLVTGVVVATKSFIENNPKTVAAFLEEYEKSVNFSNENVEEAAALIGEIGIVKAPIAQKALPFCNMKYIDGAEMKEAVSGYLEVLAEQNIKSVGGALPDEAFYYIAE